MKGAAAALALCLTVPAYAAGDEAGDDGALERALVARGRAVLPAGTFELSPALAWDHSGANATGDVSQSCVAAIALGVGLPWDVQVTASVPYFIHAETPWGENQGLGDGSVALSKQIGAGTNGWPSLVATVAWSAPTGQDQFETNVPLGAGFHALRGTLSFVKSIDPIAYYGDVSYRSPQTWDREAAAVRPGDAVSVRGGATLAVTPDISLGAGVSFAFVDAYEESGLAVPNSAATIGAAELTTGFVVSRSLFVHVSAQFGVTDDAPDVGLAVTVPVRF